MQGSKYDDTTYILAPETEFTVEVVGLKVICLKVKI